MTILNTVCSVSYPGDGVKVTFDFNFPIPEGAIRVYLREGEETNLVDSSEYGVTGFGEKNGGSVTFGTAPTATQIVVIKRYLEPTQSQDLTPDLTEYVAAVTATTNKVQDAVNAHADQVESVLDRHAMVMQQLQNDMSRAVKIPEGGNADAEEVIGSLQETADALTGRMTKAEEAVAANTADVAKNASDIAVNASNIEKNATDISGHGSSIEENAAKIAKNASDISDLQSSSSTIFSKYYESREVAIGNSWSSDTFSHGLGQLPKLVQVVLVCKVAQYGFNVGEEIVIGVGYSYNSQYSVFTTSSTASVIKLNQRVAGGIFAAYPQNTMSSLTNTNFRVKVRAWA